MSVPKCNASYNGSRYYVKNEHVGSFLLEGTSRTAMWTSIVSSIIILSTCLLLFITTYMAIGWTALTILLLLFTLSASSTLISNYINYEKPLSHGTKECTP